MSLMGTPPEPRRGPGIPDIGPLSGRENKSLGSEIPESGWGSSKGRHPR